MRCVLAVIAVALLLCPLARAQETKLDLEKTFDAGNALLEQERYAEALTEYRKILAVDPESDATLQNGAMAAYFAGDYSTALTFYKKLKISHPDDGFMRSKLVQVYQAQGDDKARDAERAALIALHLSGKDTSALGRRPDFCRDQYRVGERRVLVYEPFVFAPRTKNGIFAPRYQFIVTDAKGTMEQRIEAGWESVKKDATGVYQPTKASNTFYFDAYYPTGPVARRTMGLFPTEPSYSATKAHVKAILEGKVKSTGSTPRKPESPAAAPPKS